MTAGDPRNHPPASERLAVLMRVHLGQITVRQAAAELGVSRQQVYRLEEAMLAGSLSALSPKKRGPKPNAVDPAVEELAEKLAAAEREREILRMKVENLSAVQKGLIERVLGRGEKTGPISRPQRPRPKVSGRVQTADAGTGGRPGDGGGCAGRAPGGPETLQGDAPPLEKRGEGPAQ